MSCWVLRGWMFRWMFRSKGGLVVGCGWVVSDRMESWETELGVREDG